MSQVHIPPAASGGYIPAHSGQPVTSRAYIPTFGMYVPPSGAYLPTYGVSHGTSHVMIVIEDFTTPCESHFVWPSPVPLQTL